MKNLDEVKRIFILNGYPIGQINRLICSNITRTIVQHAVLSNVVPYYRLPFTKDILTPLCLWFLMNSPNLKFIFIILKPEKIYNREGPT